VSDRSYPSLSAKTLKELLVGQKKLLTLVYPCDSPTKKRWFSLIGLHLSPDKQAGVVLLHVNLTDMVAGQKRPATSPRRQSRSSTNLEAISGAIERSVLETVSSQLNTMRFDNDDGTAHDASAYDDIKESRAQLSKRQMEVLRLLGEGKTNNEIATTLFRSPHTIKLHVSAILRQLKLKSRTQAALLASKIYKQGSANLRRSGAEAWKKASTPHRN
jgi:DNA-binding CsgD family transcriptional regulator